MFRFLAKHLAIPVLKSVLWLIDKDYRTPEDISQDNDKKFVATEDCDFESDFGRATRAFRTVPYRVWLLKTETHELIAADRHLVVRDDDTLVWIENLKPGDNIKTDTGVE